MAGERSGVTQSGERRSSPRCGAASARIASVRPFYLIVDALPCHTARHRTPGRPIDRETTNSRFRSARSRVNSYCASTLAVLRAIARTVVARAQLSSIADPRCCVVRWLWPPVLRASKLPALPHRLPNRPHRSRRPHRLRKRPRHPRAHAPSTGQSPPIPRRACRRCAWKRRPSCASSRIDRSRGPAWPAISRIGCSWAVRPRSLRRR